MDPELPESPDLRGHWQTQGMIKAKYPVETTTGRLSTFVDATIRVLYTSGADSHPWAPAYDMSRSHFAVNLGHCVYFVM